MIAIYYKTAKTSVTGKKIQDLIDRAEKIKVEINKFVDELKSTNDFLKSDRYIFGTGIVALKFETEPNMKVWKNFKGFPGCYSPRMSCDEGKKLAKRIDSFDKIDRCEISKIIRINNFFNRPGLQFGKSDEFFGISVAKEWNHTMPEDCFEITGSEFDKL